MWLLCCWVVVVVVDVVAALCVASFVVFLVADEFAVASCRCLCCSIVPDFVIDVGAFICVSLALLF